MRARLRAWFVPSAVQWATFWRTVCAATLAFIVVREIVALVAGFPAANDLGGFAFAYVAGLMIGRRDCQAQHPEAD